MMASYRYDLTITIKKTEVVYQSAPERVFDLQSGHEING